MKKTRSHLEQGFARIFAAVAAECPRPEREFRFHPTRKWRLDFAWPMHRVGVEIDGGIFIGGGHNRGVQFTKDAEKQNAMTMLGWRLLRYTTKDLEKRPVQCVEEVAELLSRITPREAPTQQQLFAIEF